MNNQNFRRFKNTYFNFKVSIIESILFFLIVLFLGQLVAGVVSAPTYYIPALSILLLPLSFFLGFGSVAFVLLKIKGMGLADIRDFLHLKLNPLQGVLAVLLYGVSLPLAEYLSMVVPVDGTPFLEDLYEFFTESMKIIFEQKIAAFIMVCLLAPLLEEFIFRGIILRGLLHSNVNPWVAIILTGFLFGAAHMNPWQFMGAGFLGIIFGFVYWRTQSLWLVIFLHFLNNSIAYAITMYNDSLEETVFEPNFQLIIGSVLLTILVIFLLYKYSLKSALKPVNQIENR
ncbi:CPBP family intramembrane metalloprotease [Flavobacteriaceae bacterium Ap0902]|nr:CPBP family intramembrane metalloprotease [Flavobacteriaceae bacterium Ap0902]